MLSITIKPSFVFRPVAQFVEGCFVVASYRELVAMRQLDVVATRAVEGLISAMANVALCRFDGSIGGGKSLLYLAGFQLGILVAHPKVIEAAALDLINAEDGIGLEDGVARFLLLPV